MYTMGFGQLLQLRPVIGVQVYAVPPDTLTDKLSPGQVFTLDGLTVKLH